MEHPADGTTNLAQLGDDKVPKGQKTMFYLVAVPSYFEKGLSRYHVYQLISNSETTYDVAKTRGDNMLMFNFEFSPITENVSQNSKNIVEFLI